MSKVDKIYSIVKRVSFALFFYFPGIASATNHFDLTSSLTQSMEKVTNLSDKLLELNGDEVLARTFLIMQLNPTVDTLKAAG